ncbi:endonuclease/exonuclease/phosphatase family protein [Candidatus Curtissbacteria bacterium]|nr:endonuclease/exonuclease/phosphatase family protein [Candidatus Curtissbacteria bacterium]
MEGVFYNDATFVSHSGSLHGNAVLSKYSIEKSEHIVLKSKETLTDEEFSNSKYFPDFPRAIVDATIRLANGPVHVLSVHGAWTAPPTDTPEALRQAKLIAEHLGRLQTPFILGGDLNTTPDKQVIKIIETAANNLITGSAITRTTHPKVHKVAAKELSVDYIFASNHFKLLQIESPVVLVSDHLPVVAKLEFKD